MEMTISMEPKQQDLQLPNLTPDFMTTPIYLVLK